LIAVTLPETPDAAVIAPEVSAWRKQVGGVHYTADCPW
jgi:hypothetical protein